MKNFCFLVIVLFAFANANAAEKKADKNHVNRDGKVFSLFTVVNFQNEACVSTSSLSSGSTQYRNGTCFTSSECSNKGGSAKGNCAAGFGVCCVFLYNTDSQTTVNYNDTYLQNPNFPSAYGETSTLSYTINKCNCDVCYIRLDFEQFTTVGPSATVEDPTTGLCTDKFTVTLTSGQSVPELCGDLTGQHIYLDVGQGCSDNAKLNMGFTGANTLRKWDIKVSQIECNKNYSPNEGCLQQHTGLTGKITTFNFVTGSQHLMNQDYSACIRQAAGYCCVQYTTCSDDAGDFSLNNENAAAAEKALINTDCLKANAAIASESSADYILIDGSGATCGDNGINAYCGQKLNVKDEALVNIPICDCSAPFFVGIRTNSVAEATSATVANKGVCLNYRQIPCTSQT